MLALQQQDALARPVSREEIIQKLEQHVGPEGRRLFEGFIAQVKTLEQQNRARLRPPLKMQATAS
jgi:hypothetical protein